MSTERNEIEKTSAYTKDFSVHEVDYSVLRTPIKRPTDNLYPEGEFDVPKKQEYQPADRPHQKRPVDNLKPEGDFTRPERIEYRPAERPQQHKPEDNLTISGDFNGIYFILTILYLSII